ncbi:MAG: type II toxin-antitoxin system HicA family toxin [Verrucomicrobia bacterium]|nr:type II toxin-antitoxin system HicA family toxin [Verrucomicrobiota bacterium]
MAKLLKVTGKELIKLLNKHGFTIVRIKGIHHFLRHLDGRRTVIPVHSGETLGPGLFLKILRDVQLSKDDIA